MRDKCIFCFILASYRADVHLFGTPIYFDYAPQVAYGVVCLAGTVIDRRHRFAEHAVQSTIK